MTETVEIDASFHHRQLLVDGLLIHVVDIGRGFSPNVLLLHGWPENWTAFRSVMKTLGQHAHVFAIDLPGIGDSITWPHSGEKASLAATILQLIDVLELDDVTLVGQDIGGQIVYAALRQSHPRVSKAVIASVAIPGIDPWDDVVSNPNIWHFGFHSVPRLPELLVSGHTHEYFDFFFEQLASDPHRIDRETRAVFSRAYAGVMALHTGFEWYRAFGQDAVCNTRSAGQEVTTPVLYLRGGEDRGEPLSRYLCGLRTAGLRNVVGNVVDDSGHFIAIEQPAALAQLLRDFLLTEPAPAETRDQRTAAR